MLEILNTDVYGLERAMKAISNSYTVGEIDTTAPVTEKNETVARSLGTNLEAHQSHDAYLKGIIVQFDIKYPQYWTPEFQRYHFADIIMSQSTMHALAKMLKGEYDPFNKYTSAEAKKVVCDLAKVYQENPTYENFVTLRSNLPAGFEMWETVTTNYLQLKTIWIQRHNHKLKEDWGVFCKWIENLPKFKELCLDEILEKEEESKKPLPVWTLKEEAPVVKLARKIIDEVNAESGPGDWDMDHKWPWSLPISRARLTFESAYRDGYGTNVIKIGGGLNGAGKWEYYLDDIKKLIEKLKAEGNGYFEKVWVISFDVDCPDDVFTIKLGYISSNAETDKD